MTRKQYYLTIVLLVTSGLLGGFLGGWYFSASAEADTAKLLAAQEIRLLDESGRTRGLLSVLRGKPRLLMSDPNGEFRLEMGFDSEGRPGIWLRDEKGRDRADLFLADEGQPALDFRDADGRSRASYNLGKDGAPTLILRDLEGRDRVALWQETADQGLALADGQGRPRAGLVMTRDDRSSLAFYDEEAKVMWYAPR